MPCGRRPRLQALGVLNHQHAHLPGRQQQAHAAVAGLHGRDAVHHRRAPALAPAQKAYNIKTMHPNVTRSPSKHKDEHPKDYMHEQSHLLCLKGLYSRNAAVERAVDQNHGYEPARERHQVWYIKNVHGRGSISASENGNQHADVIFMAQCCSPYWASRAGAMNKSCARTARCRGRAPARMCCRPRPPPGDGR